METEIFLYMIIMLVCGIGMGAILVYVTCQCSKEIDLYYKELRKEDD